MSALPEGFGAALVREGLREASAGTIAAIAADRIRWPTGGGVPVVLGLGLDGQPREGATVSDLLRELRAAYPDAWAESGMEEGPPAPTTLTARARAEHQAAQASAKAAAEQSDESNPYRAATWNLTRQAVLEKRDPAKAARMKAEAAR